MDPNTAAILQGIHQSNLQAQQANNELLNELVNLNKQMITQAAQGTARLTRNWRHQHVRH